MVYTQKVVRCVVRTTQNATRYNITLSIAQIRGIGPRQKTSRILKLILITQPQSLGPRHFRHLSLGPRTPPRPSSASICVICGLSFLSHVPARALPRDLATDGCAHPWQQDCGSQGAGIGAQYISVEAQGLCGSPDRKSVV